MSASVETHSRFKTLLEDKVAQARQSHAFKGYAEVRDFVLQAMDALFKDSPSEYWQQEIAGFEYMFDASPLVVDKLRHHCYHLTGLKDYDYRQHHIRQSDNVAKKLKACKSVDKSNLQIPESPELGGFGFEFDGGLYNLDTIKYYQILLGLDQSGVLDALKLKDKTASERPIVMEIGAGWGGFAYQFKTLFPNSTYVIVDLTPTLLFSGTYLKALFPQAKILMLPEAPVKLSAKELAQYDFVLLPHTSWPELTLEKLDLCINMVSFQEMTDEQVTQYVSKVKNWKTPYLYSYNRNISPNNPEISGVFDIMEKYYQTEELQLFPTSKQKLSMSKRVKQALGMRKYGAATANPDHLYRHVIGRL